jgi:hypothetical protein
MEEILVSCGFGLFSGRTSGVDAAAENAAVEALRFGAQLRRQTCARVKNRNSEARQSIPVLLLLPFRCVPPAAAFYVLRCSRDREIVVLTRDSAWKTSQR